MNSPFSLCTGTQCYRKQCVHNEKGEFMVNISYVFRLLQRDLNYIAFEPLKYILLL